MSNDTMTMFSVCYDIQRPWDKTWHEVKQKKKEELTPKEKQEIDRRKYWDKLIGEFITELEKIGFRINWSVFLIPDTHYNNAKNLVDRYTKKFSDMNVGNDIYILKYHPDSNSTLLDKAKLHMKIRIEKLVKKMVKGQEENNSNEVKYLKREVEGIVELSKVFSEEIPNELINYYNDVANNHGLVNVKLSISQTTLEELI